MKMRHIASASLVLVAIISAASCGRDEARSAEAVSQSSAAPVTVASAPAENTASAAQTVKVYKDPNCGCCNKWVDHMKENGFTVETMDMPNLSMIKQKYAIGANLQSCHTAVVGDYAFEGHVPADLIARVLEEKPSIAGLAVPGMPMGSPGMEGATKDAYDVLTFDRDGRTTVYAQR